MNYDTKTVRISDIIEEKDMMQWKNGDTITISAGTGRGKSYFIKNMLYDFAKRNNKKILMLIHRSNCVNQFQQEIERDNKTNFIDIRTYQNIEFKGLHNKDIDLSKYQYIVCDEFHYFSGDAAFSCTTDISLDAILSQSTAIRILLSATGEPMKEFLNKTKYIDTINYNLPTNYDYIKELKFICHYDTFDTLLQEFVENKTKAIFFINKIGKAYELYKQHKNDCLFCCSKENKYYRFVEEAKINRMLESERFEETVLITTSCLDSGVNIVDTELKNIVIDIRDTGSLVQCIGRKRVVNDDDRISLFVLAIDNKKLGGMKRCLKKRLEMACYFREHGLEKLLLKYPRQSDTNKIIYDIAVSDCTSTKKINELMYYKNILDLKEINTILELGTLGYCEYLSKLFNKGYVIIEKSTSRNDLAAYLDSLNGKKIGKDGKKELIKKIDHRVNGRQQRSYKKLNTGLDMINLPFVIIPKRNNDSSYWMVEKIG